VSSPGDPAAVVALLLRTGVTLGSAESLTGGLLGGALTSVSGSSAVYVGGVVTYATRLKVSVLGVPESVVEREGVVSEACARAMAEGARTLLGADWAVSTTGVAGPDLQEGKPAGTAYVGLAGPGGTTVRGLRLAGDRAAVRHGVVAEALDLVLDTVGQNPGREVAGLE
jgi:PncC family amidohydrolase